MQNILLFNKIFVNLIYIILLNIKRMKTASNQKKVSIKLRVVNAIEQGLGLTVLDIRKVRKDNESNFYVATDNGLMQCEVTGRKVHYQYAVIAGQGSLKIPKKSELKSPKEIKIVEEAKKYSAEHLILNPANWLNKEDEEVMKKWRHAVYTVTAGSTREVSYAAAVTVYNLK